MKTLIISILLLLSANLFAQNPGRLPYKTVIQYAGGDTVQTKLQGDTVYYSTDKSFFNFNKPLLVNGDTISGGAGMSIDTSLFVRKAGTQIITGRKTFNGGIYSAYQGNDYAVELLPNTNATGGIKLDLSDNSAEGLFIDGGESINKIRMKSYATNNKSFDDIVLYNSGNAPLFSINAFQVPTGTTPAYRFGTHTSVPLTTSPHSLFINATDTLAALKANSINLYKKTILSLDGDSAIFKKIDDAIGLHNYVDNYESILTGNALTIIDNGNSLSSTYGASGANINNAIIRSQFGGNCYNYNNIGMFFNTNDTIKFGKNIDGFTSTYRDYFYVTKQGSIGIVSNGVKTYDVDSTGTIKNAFTPHAQSIFFDSAVSITLVQNTWYQLTRQGAKTTWPTTEFYGFTDSGDTITAQYSGHYVVNYELNMLGSDAKTYEYRIMRKNGTISEVWRFKVTGTGTDVMRYIGAYLDLEPGSKYWIEIRSTSAAPGIITIYGGRMTVAPIHLNIN